jgi:hypothetical protein
MRMSESAFPQIEPIMEKRELGYYKIGEKVQAGLTKREWFAGMALQGIWANGIKLENYETTSKVAFRQADAMIEVSKEGEREDE